MIVERIRKFRRNSYFKDTALSLSSKAAAMVLFLVADILAARLLGDTDYGEWCFYYSIMNIFFWVIGFGIDPSARVFTARDRENAQIRDMNIRAGLTLRLIVSAFFTVLIVLMAEPISGWLGYPQKYAHLKTLMLIAAPLCFFYTFSNFFKDLFVGLVNFKAIAFLALSEYGGYVVFGAGILLLTRSVHGLAWGYTFAVVINTVLGFYLLSRQIGKKTISIHGPSADREIMTRIFRYAIPLMLINIGAMVLADMDTFMLGIMSTAEETGYYSIAKNLILKVSNINLAITVAMTTPFGVMNQGNIASLRKKMKMTIGVNLLITLSVCAAFLLLGPWAIRLLYGPDYAASGAVLWSLLPYYFMKGMSLAFSNVMDYQGKANSRAAWYVLAIILNLVLNWFMIPRYGSVGAALATCISIIPYFIAIIFSTTRIFRDFSRVELVKND